MGPHILTQLEGMCKKKIFLSRTMAPTNRKDHLDAAYVKVDMFSSVEFSPKVPFVSLKSVERDYGL